MQWERNLCNVYIQHSYTESKLGGVGTSREWSYAWWSKRSSIAELLSCSLLTKHFWYVERHYSVNKTCVIWGLDNFWNHYLQYGGNSSYLCRIIPVARALRPVVDVGLRLLCWTVKWKFPTRYHSHLTCVWCALLKSECYLANCVVIFKCNGKRRWCGDKPRFHACSEKSTCRHVSDITRLHSCSALDFLNVLAGSWLYENTTRYFASLFMFNMTWPPFVDWYCNISTVFQPFELSNWHRPWQQCWMIEFLTTLQGVAFYMSQDNV